MYEGQSTVNMLQWGTCLGAGLGGDALGRLLHLLRAAAQARKAQTRRALLCLFLSLRTTISLHTASSLLQHASRTQRGGDDLGSVTLHVIRALQHSSNAVIRSW